ncbi:unnamed protein product [Adineta steineri]|uniref:NHL repeat containing protein n=1 Tax=Adineta steineri TaxID=433720 RepID=A0A815PTL1_9BILA|nr:unnamed protein product [Adineta steineri]
MGRAGPEKVNPWAIKLRPGLWARLSSKSSPAHGRPWAACPIKIWHIHSISHNQPKLCANATWNQTAITFATSTLVGIHPEGIFVDRNNSVYVADYTDGRILIWLNGSTTLTGNISSGLNTPYGLFVTSNGDLYVGNAYSDYRVDKWAWNRTNSVPAMYICSLCYGIFVDINNMLYCSMYYYHQVVYKSLTQNLNVWSNVAGVSNTAGSTSTTLNGPMGIFVDNYLNLYVADFENGRIQKFASGQLNGATISTGAITLSHPTSVMLDSDGYMFISDNSNHRIIGSGPNGFRCIAACSGSPGSSASQLCNPQSISFDSYGNIFVTDYNNNRVQKFLLLSNGCNTTTATTTIAVISFNQPIFGAYATWNNVSITFANSSTVGTSPYGIFVDTNNTVYVANQASNQIQIWLSGSSIPTRNITSGVTSPYSIFATITGDIYVDNGYTNNRVDKWASYGNISSSVMQVQGACYDLFIDVNNTLYCSLYTQNQVAIKSLNGNSSMWIVAAGTECSGSTSNALTNPRGIFVDTNLNLYVADCGNDRVQLFLSGQVTATTVAGSTATGTISLDCPSDVALDGGGYLFIVDSNNNRIIGSGPNGFRCIIACASTSGSASNQLSSPSTFSFDSYGNIYVTDQVSTIGSSLLVIEQQYRPPPPLLLRAAAAVPPLELLLPPLRLQAVAVLQVPLPLPPLKLQAVAVLQVPLPPLRLQAVAVLQVPLPLQPVPQVEVLQAVAVLRVPLPPPPAPQVALPVAVLLLVVAVPPAALLLLPPVLRVVLLLPSEVPLLLLLPPLVLPRAAVLLQAALLPRPPLAVLLQAVVALQVAVVLRRAAALLQVALLPRPPVAVPPQAAVALQVALQQVAVVRQVVLRRAAAVPQVALPPRPPVPVPLRSVAAPQVVVLQVVLPQAPVVPQVALPPPAAVLQRVVAVPQAVLPLPLAVRQVAPLLPLARQQVAAVPQVVLLPRLPLAVPLRAVAVLRVVLLLPLVLQRAAVVPQVAVQPVVAVPQAVLQRAVVVLQVAPQPRPPLAVPLQAAAAPQVALQQVAVVPLAVPLRAVAVLQLVLPLLLVVPQVARHPSQLLKHQISMKVII